MILKAPHNINNLCRAIIITIMIISSFSISVYAQDPPTNPEWNSIEDFFLLLKNTKKKTIRQKLYSEVEKKKLTSYADALDAYKRGVLSINNGSLVIYEKSQSAGDKKLYPLIYAESGNPVLNSNGEQILLQKYVNMLKAKRPDRKLISNTVKALNLRNVNIQKQREAIIASAQRKDKSSLKILNEINSKVSANSDYINEAIAIITLYNSNNNQEIISTISTLANTGTVSSQIALQDYLKEHKNLNIEIKKTIINASSEIEWNQKVLRFIRNTFAGLSLGSILILLALGLSVIFGLMGVINMAHGEFMMLGAFSTYVVCELFKRYMPPQWFDYYFIVAIPVAFLVSAAIGYLCELLIIKKLYGRPFETILATWGLSLVLIQSVRVIFGDTLSLTPPSWLTGGWEVTPDLILPINRIFIILFSLTCVFLFYMLIKKTKLGLLVRATTQDRPTADSCGVPVRTIDGLTFAIGSGLAGLAGCAVPLFDKINPSMGQSYIVDSFMVVVLGGVGKLAGIVLGGLGLGFVSKYLEPISGAVYGKVIVLLLIVIFLQWRPSGLFPAKGRSADD